MKKRILLVIGLMALLSYMVGDTYAEAIIVPLIILGISLYYGVDRRGAITKHIEYGLVQQYMPPKKPSLTSISGLYTIFKDSLGNVLMNLVFGIPVIGFSYLLVKKIVGFFIGL